MPTCRMSSAHSGSPLKMNRLLRGVVRVVSGHSRLMTTASAWQKTGVTLLNSHAAPCRSAIGRMPRSNSTSPVNRMVNEASSCVRRQAGKRHNTHNMPDSHLNIPYYKKSIRWLRVAGPESKDVSILEQAVSCLLLTSVAKPRR